MTAEELAAWLVTCGWVVEIEGSATIRAHRTGAPRRERLYCREISLLGEPYWIIEPISKGARVANRP